MNNFFEVPTPTFKFEVLKPSGKTAVQIEVAIGFVYLSDLCGPSVVTKLDVPKKARQALAPQVYNAVHVGISNTKVLYPPGGLGIWVIVKSKGQLVRHVKKVAGYLANGVTMAVEEFLLHHATPERDTI